MLQPAPTTAPVTIHVSGAVQQPGVYELSPDCRVAEAIQAAGGFSGDADQEVVNLAALLIDGDKIVIPKVGEQPSEPVMVRSAPEALMSADDGTTAPAGPVNINTATKEELMTLPNIGEKRAGDIISYRETRGGFKTIEELDQVSGIGPATFEKLKDLVTVR